MKKKDKKNTNKFRFEGRKYNIKKMTSAEILAVLHRQWEKEDRKKIAKAKRKAESMLSNLNFPSRYSPITITF